MIRHSLPYLFTLFLWLELPLVFAQNAGEFLLQKTVEAKTDFFTADPLGNLYWTNRQELIKYDAASGQTSHYSNPRYGNIQTADASDPLNILVFHGDFNHIAWLDRNLALRETHAMPPEMAREFPKAICRSTHGGFWVYLPRMAKLQRFDQHFRLQAQSLPFNEILPGVEEPVFLTEADGRVYAAIPNKGIAVFDAFGNLIFLIEKTGIERFQVQANRLLYFSEKELIIFDFVLQEENVFLLPETNIRSGLVRGRRVFVQTDNEIRIYQAAGRLF